MDYPNSGTARSQEFGPPSKREKYATLEKISLCWQTLVCVVMVLSKEATMTPDKGRMLEDDCLM